MEENKDRALIIKTMQEKSCLKNTIFKQSLSAMTLFKSKMNEIIQDLQKNVNQNNTNLHFHFKDKNKFEAEMAFAGDTLLFMMHSNVFYFEKEHAVWRDSYVKEDETRAYCSVLNIYNFLTDSFRYHRESDIGYLIGRVFINKDNHYFVEGRKQLGFLYNDFANAVLDEEAVEKIIQSAMLHTLNFDLLLPNYDQVKFMSVSQVFANSEMTSQQTGKRLGFVFEAQNDKQF